MEHFSKNFSNFFQNPFEGSSILARGLRGSARFSGAPGALSRSKLLRSRLLKNSRRPRRHFGHVFSLDLADLALQLARPRVPGTPRVSTLEPETAVFFRFLRAASVRCAKRPTSKKHRKNQYETRFGAAVH